MQSPFWAYYLPSMGLEKVLVQDMVSLMWEDKTNQRAVGYLHNNVSFVQTAYSLK